MKNNLVKMKLKPKAMEEKTLRNLKHFASISTGFSDALVTGKFCDVKIICQDYNLWAHRLVLSTVSPFLQALLVDFERRGEDVITIFLPLIKGYHMKLVLDYIYGGAMYLCGSHMQYVIQVLEVLQLQCGVSVNRMVRTEDSSEDKQWIEVEHSTVKIKSNCPPQLPKLGVPRSSQSTQTVSPPLAKKPTEIRLDSSEDDCVLLDEGAPKDAEAGAGGEEEAEGVTEIVTEDDDSDREAEDPAKEDPATSQDKDKPGGDKDESEELVVVEIDEAFAVNSLTSSEASQHGGKKHKCALCGRFFRYYENLRIHLTGHLGVKVSLSRCNPCKRNFKNQKELTLHNLSHSYARHLGKYRIAKSAEETARKEAKIVTTVGGKDKKIVRKYAKDRATAGILTRNPPEKDETRLEATRGKVNQVQGPLTCVLCDETFEVKSALMRHISQKHKDATEKTKNVLKNPAFVRLRNCSAGGSKKAQKSPGADNSRSPFGQLVTRSPSSGPRLHIGQLVTRSPASTRSPARDWATPPGHESPRHTVQSPQVSNPYSRQYSTPSRKRQTSESSISSNPRKRETSDSDLSPPLSKKSKAGHHTTRTENNLQCPDCDRVFVAKTILERHLYTAKHGVHSLYSSDSGPGSPHHRTQPPKQSVNDRVVDCHLCGQKFTRVKDLAKHREKLCTAYKNLGH